MLTVAYHITAPKFRPGLSRSNSVPTRKPGGNSGKRTLRDVLDDDLVAKRIKTVPTGSDTGQRSRRNVTLAVRQELAFSTSDELPETSNISSRKHHRDDLTTHEKENIAPGHHLEGDLGELPDSIHQEDGYISPSTPYFRLATPDLSSPVRHPFRVTPRGQGNSDDFWADVISSPLAINRRSQKRNVSPHEPGEPVNILVCGTPPPFGGPDLRDVLSICSMDEAEELEEHETSGAVPFSHPGSETASTISEDPDPDTCEMRMHAVANGWRNKWAMKQEPHSARVSNLVDGSSDTEF